MQELHPDAALPGTAEALTADAFARHLASGFAAAFPGAPAAATEAIAATVRRVLALQADSDALYHAGRHTILVTLAGERMLAGLLQEAAVDATDWLHVVLALVAHDAGYARGACRGDSPDSVVIDADGRRMDWPRGASDAILRPHHVARSMIHARETHAGSALVDGDRVAGAIAATRFPPAPEGIGTLEGRLLAAADLVGQLADPHYLAQTHALFREMEETGEAAALGHGSRDELIAALPDFYRTQVEPVAAPGLALLARTAAGRAWIAQLDANLAEAVRRSAD